MSISQGRRASDPNSSQGNGLLKAALKYEQWGFSVIPIAANKKPPKSMRWKKFQRKRATPEEIVGWFEEHEITGIAIVCGQVSGGLGCRDFDEVSAYESWRDQYPRLAARLPTVRTARGYHVYFRCKAEAFEDLSDGELRADSKHYCVLPPSVHDSGHRYSWINEPPDGEIEWLDPIDAGFLPHDTESTETTESTEDNRETEAIRERVENAIKTRKDSIVLDADTEREIDEAIRATLPKAQGKRNGCIFEFARWLKSIPALADADLRDLREIVRKWHAQALPVIGTKPFEDSWGDFTNDWKKIRFPKGDDPVQEIYQRAERQPMPTGAELYDDERTKQLLRFCAEFQRTVGDAVFFLSCRTAGRLFFEGDYKTAARRLNLFQDDRFLKRTQRGGEGRAARYRYIAPLRSA